MNTSFSPYIRLTLGAAILSGLMATAFSARAANETIPKDRGFYVFGDSEVEMGNIYLDPRFVDPVPAELYFQDGGWQRDSNGPVWAEYLAPGLRPVNAGEPYGNRLNFAHSGATTGPLNLAHDDFGVQYQLDRFDALVASRTIRPGAQDIFVVEAGPNDFQDGLFIAGDSDESGFTDALVARYAGNQRRAVERLGAAGAKLIFVMDLPDVQLAPLWASHWPEADGRAAIQAAFADGVVRGRAALTAALMAAQLPADATAVIVQQNALLHHVGEHYRALGFSHDLSEACLNSLTLSQCSTDPNVQNSYIFYDSLHLTTTAHRLTSRYYATLIDQVLGGANRRFARLADTAANAADGALDSIGDARDQLARDAHGFSTFGQAGWRRRSSSARDDAAGFTDRLWTALGGFSYADGEGWSVSVGAGRTAGSLSWAGGGGGNVRGATVALASQNRWGAFRLASELSYTWLHFDSIDRPTGIATLRPQGDTRGTAYGLRFGAGWQFDLKPVILTPTVRVAYRDLRIGGFTETQGAGLELTYDRLRREDAAMDLGFTAATRPYQLSQMVTLAPTLSAFYSRRLDSARTKTVARLADNIAKDIVASSPSEPRDSGFATVGLRFGFGQRAGLNLGVTGAVHDRFEPRASLGFSLNF